MTTSNPELLTLSQIASRAGVSPAAVSNWRRRHADTFPAPVRDDLFDAAMVDRWLSDRSPRQAPPKSMPHRWAWDLMSSVRGELDVGSAATVAATLVTLLHLDSRADIDRLSQAVTRVERDGDLPPGTLSIPLEPAARLAPATLAGLAERVRDQLVSTSAERVFDALLTRGDGPMALAEHSTPPQLIDFLVSLAPTDVTSVLDPACGTGALLAAAATQSNADMVQGYDVNATAWALCVQRLTLHNLPTEALRQGDFFAHSATKTDLVVSAPPLGLHFPPGSPAVALLETLSAGDSFRNCGDFAWLFAARDALSESGTAIVVTAAKPTFAGGASRRLRHELLRSGSVAAVIALPGGMVAGATIPVVAWILRPPSPDARRVLMINANNRATRRPDPDLLQVASREYRAWRTEPDTYEPTPGMATAVSILELLAGDISLTPAKWTEVPVDQDSALREARQSLDQLAVVQQIMSNLRVPDMELAAGGEVDLVSLEDLADRGLLAVQRPRHINRDAINDKGPYPYVTGVTDEGPRIVGYLTELPHHLVITQPGDIILSTLGQVRATVDIDGGHVLGSAVWLIRSLTDNPALQPDLLALLLASPRIAEQTVGTTVQRLRHPKDVTIPLLPASTGPPAAAWARATARARLSAERLSAAVAAATSSLAAALDAGVVVREQAMRDDESGDTKRGHR